MAQTLHNTETYERNKNIILRHENTNFGPGTEIQIWSQCWEIQIRGLHWVILIEVQGQGLAERIQKSENINQWTRIQIQTVQRVLRVNRQMDRRVVRKWSERYYQWTEVNYKWTDEWADD